MTETILYTIIKESQEKTENPKKSRCYLKKQEMADGFVKNFRSGVRFTERFFKNLKIQTKCIIKTSKQIYTWMKTRKSNPLPIFCGLVVFLFICIAIIPIIFWVIVKSI